MRVGVISDTHGLLRPEATRALAGADLIVHAGDVGKPEVLAELKAIAPVFAVRGNVDTGQWAKELPVTTVVDAGAACFYVLRCLLAAPAEAVTESRLAAWVENFM